MRDLARPHPQRLRDQSGETVHLAVKSGDALVNFDKNECRELVRMRSTIGTRVPLHSSGVGKAYLAALPADEIQKLLHRLDLRQITKFTAATPETLSTQLSTCRAQDYIFDKQDTTLAGVPSITGKGLLLARTAESKKGSAKANPNS